MLNVSKHVDSRQKNTQARHTASHTAQFALNETKHVDSHPKTRKQLTLNKSRSSTHTAQRALKARKHKPTWVTSKQHVNSRTTHASKRNCTQHATCGGAMAS